MKNKSVGKNAILNVIKTVIALLFPLITFPYISRVLQVDNLGKVNFANSVVNYFILFATLGLGTYGVREGAALRDDRDKFQKFFSEVYTISLFSTLISLIGLVVITIFLPGLRSYELLILILSISVILPTIGCGWVCAAYEDFGYITIRTILVQIISLALIFAFIHIPGDYYKYAAILVFSSQGANIFNLFYIRRYVKIVPVLHMNASKHLKPLLILFASSLATSIYVSSDTTVLGFVCGDYYTGLYGAATKLYSVLKNLISAIVIVSIPRFSFYYGSNKREEFDSLLNKISKALVIITLPIVAGVFTLSREIILFISGKQYIEASSALRILSVAVLFVAISWIQSQCILVPMKQEKAVLYTTIFTAILNVVLNILLVGKWKHNATALTTLISEACVVIIYFRVIGSKVRFPKIGYELFHGLIAAVAMIGALYLIGRIDMNIYIQLPLSVLIGALVYAVILLLLRDKVAILIINKIFKKLGINID